MAKASEKALAEKLAVLGRGRRWSLGAVERLGNLIRTGSDRQLFRVDPARFASENGVRESESIDLFLQGTRLGMFRMEWHLQCPTCGDAVRSFATLAEVPEGFHCCLCGQDASATLDGCVRVSFTVSPDLRLISFHSPGNLSPEAYHLEYHLDPAAVVPGQGRFVDVLRSFSRGMAYLEPGKRRRFEVETTGGLITFSDLMNGASATLPVGGAPALSRLTVTVRLEDGKLVPDRPSVPAGRHVFVTENRTGRKASMIVVNFPDDFEPRHLAFGPRLTGARLLCSQTFRSLFSSEVIRAAPGIPAGELAILFTDLAGSTALCGRMGDLPALALVEQHFDEMRRVISRNSGALVKIMGDSAMACFPGPGQAVKAGLDIMKETSRLAPASGGRGLALRIGIHAGPCVAVTSNDRLDYFGRTVNVAARLAGLARPNEICVTEKLFLTPGIRGQLGGVRVFRGKAPLAGFPSEVMVYRIARSGSVLGLARPTRPRAAPVRKSAP